MAATQRQKTASDGSSQGTNDFFSRMAKLPGWMLVFVKYGLARSTTLSTEHHATLLCPLSRRNSATLLCPLSRRNSATLLCPLSRQNSATLLCPLSRQNSATLPEKGGGGSLTTVESFWPSSAGSEAGPCFLPTELSWPPTSDGDAFRNASVHFHHWMAFYWELPLDHRFQFEELTDLLLEVPGKRPQWKFRFLPPFWNSHRRMIHQNGGPLRVLVYFMGIWFSNVLGSAWPESWAYINGAAGLHHYRWANTLPQSYLAAGLWQIFDFIKYQLEYMWILTIVTYTLPGIMLYSCWLAMYHPETRIDTNTLALINGNDILKKVALYDINDVIRGCVL